MEGFIVTFKTGPLIQSERMWQGLCLRVNFCLTKLSGLRNVWLPSCVPVTLRPMVQST